jgi:hypothetical protein
LLLPWYSLCVGGAGAFAGFGFSGGGIMPLGASYEITAEGTFKKGGWEINRQGVKTPPKPFDEKGGLDDGRPGSRELDSPSYVADCHCHSSSHRHMT